MNLRAMFERAVERYPEAEAIVEGDRRFSYKRWNERIDRVAGGFAEMGVAKGDRVVIALSNREQTACAYWACQKLAAVATPINFRFSPEEIAYVLNDAQARLFVMGDESKDAAERSLPLLAKRPPLVYTGAQPLAGARPFEALAGGAAPLTRREPLSDDDLNLILYTAGTTGRPKGVPRTHRNDYAATMAELVQFHWSLHERTLGVMPLFHTMGMHTLTAMAFVNGLFVAQPRFDALQALELIARERISALYLIPTIFHELLHHPAAGRCDLSSVRKVSYAGAPMTRALTLECDTAFKPEVLVNHYGSTEVYTFSICEHIREKPGCAGRAAMNGTLRVVKAERERRVAPGETVAQGEVGEIIVGADSDEAFAGYLNRPDASAEALRDGWYFTGDLGYLDPEGDLWVVGRVDDMIISGGENIHPTEVEEVLVRHPQVREAAVAGLPDDKWGQVVAAFVVPTTEDLSGEDLDRHCLESASLAGFKRPRRYVFVRAIPKSQSGKVLRRKLQAGEYETLTPHRTNA